MKILIVDDNDDKRARIKYVLFERLPNLPEVSEAVDYERAINAIEESHFDLVILDLLLPGAGNDANLQTSQAIMKSVISGTAKYSPSHVIGLTAYEDAAAQASTFYDQNLLSLEVYSEINDRWADRLVGKIKYLIKSKQAATSFQANAFDYDLVVITARYDTEYLPIRDWLLPYPTSMEHPLWDGKISFGHLEVPGHRTLRVVVCCIGEMGMAPAAATASQAITIFRPRLLTMLGICCGFSTNQCSSPRKMMDVIVARDVACWEEGKYIDENRNHPEYRNRSIARPVDDRIRERVGQAIEAEVDILLPGITAFAQSEDYRLIYEHFGDDKIRLTPDVRYAPMVSGSSVIADHAMISQILDRHPDAVGLDMELYGVYTAVEKSFGRKPSILGIKGVADFGDAKKDDRAQKAASQLSAEVLKGLLPTLGIW